jgi:uncharacterized protein YndB with AHSA1/START domain
MTAGGDSVAVTIGSPAHRVFSSLANHDSMSTWGLTTRDESATGRGSFENGDRLAVGASARGRRQRMMWTVVDVVPDRLVVLELRSDSGMVLATRRDSLVALGDSTRIVSTIASPMFESLQRGAERGNTTSATSTAITGMGSKVMIGGFRLQSEKELKRLKARLEGTGVTPR